MLNKTFKKSLAAALAATMVVGSSVTVFASGNTANVGGDAIDHLDTEILTVTLPTSTAVETAFHYTVDPERVINSAGSMLDGTSVAENEDGVYFGNGYYDGDGIAVTSSAAITAYSSTSDKVAFVGKNSVDVEVSVKAEVTATAGGTDIELVTDEEALAAAKNPALMLTLTVGEDAKAIPSTASIMSKSTIPGIPANFTTVVSGSAFSYKVKESGDTGFTAWNSTKMALSGKTNNMTVTDTMTAPTIALTWSVAKAPEVVNSFWDGLTLWMGKNETDGFGTISKIELSVNGGSYSTVVTDPTASANKFKVDDNNWINVTWDDLVSSAGAGVDADTIKEYDVKITNSENTVFVYHGTN